MFNPNNHMTQIKTKEGMKDYLGVQWRLVWFRGDCPEGTIETEMLMLEPDRETEEEGFAWNEEKRRSEKIMKRANGFAVFRAKVTDGKGGSAMGTKSEKAASFADYSEKAETGAIGRALAALGYGTQFVADEFDEGERIVDAPVQRKPSEKPAMSPVSRPTSNDPASSTQTPSESPEEVKKLLGTVKSLLNAHYQIPQVDQPAKWKRFKEQVLGLPVEDEGLSLPELKRLRDAVKMKIERAKGAA